MSAAMGKPYLVLADSRCNSQLAIPKNAKGNARKHGILSSNALIKASDIMELMIMKCSGYAAASLPAFYR